MVVITDLDEAAAAGGGGVLHPDDVDSNLEVAAVGAGALDAGTEAAAVGAAGGDALHPDDDGDGVLRPDGQIVKATELMDLTDSMLAEVVKRLPLKDAVATSVLSSTWRRLWYSRRAIAARNWYIHIHPTAASPTRVLDEMAHTIHYDLERVNLIIENPMEEGHLQRFMMYANERHVKHLRVRGYLHRRQEHIHVPHVPFNLSLANPSLESLCLEEILVARLFCHDDREPFHSLRSIRLVEAQMTRNTFNRLLNLCPQLRTIDIRWCGPIEDTFFSPMVTYQCPNLYKITIGHCLGATTLQSDVVPQLESFVYFNNFLDGGFALPETAMLTDLYICFEKRVSRSPTMYDKLCFSLPNHLTALKVLSICTRTLRVVIAKFYLAAGSDKLLDLKLLSELQLLVFALDPEDLGHVYAFLKQCNCPNLKRLFVHSSICLSQTSLNSFSIHKEDVDYTSEVMLEDEPQSDLTVDIAKVAQVTWSYTQVKLICFLLKVVEVLHVVSEATLPENVVGNTDSEVNLIKKAVGNGKIVITEPMSDKLLAFHGESYLH